mgnify:CR=1 FL=1
MGELKFESELVFAKRSVQWIIILAISCVMMRMMHCRPVVPLRPAVLNEQLPDDVSVRWGQQAEHPVSARSEGMRRGGAGIDVLEMRLGTRQRRWLAQVNLNSANALELALLPGVGPVLASRIVEDRVSRGVFESVDDLQRVRGIGSGKLAGIREMAVVTK